MSKVTWNHISYTGIYACSLHVNFTILLFGHNKFATRPFDGHHYHSFVLKGTGKIYVRFYKRKSSAAPMYW